MEALNTFQTQIAEKFENMANITKHFVMGTKHGHYQVQQLHQAETMLNTSYATIWQMHDNTRLKQQNIIQKIVQAQQYQQNWHEYQVLTGNSRNRKRSAFSFLSCMFSGILTVKASTVFSFLPILHLFTSMGQLLQDTQNNYDTTNTPFKSTHELDFLFEQTKKFSMETYSEMLGKDD